MGTPADDGLITVVVHSLSTDSRRNADARRQGPCVLPDSIRLLSSRHPAGLFCRKQVFRAGHSDASITRWLQAELITRLAPGWYRDESCTRHPLERQHLVEGYFAMSALDPRPVISGTAALECYGVLGPGMEATSPPTVLVPWGGRVRIRSMPFRAHQQRDLVDVPVRRISGLRVASPARALADMFRVEGRPLDDVVHAAYLAVNTLRLRPTNLLDDWARSADPGSARLVELARTGVLDVESPAEWTVLRDVFGRFPPAPDPQVQVTRRHRADFAYVFAALILEYQSERFHKGRVDEDGVRMADYRRSGWDALGITKSMVRDAAGTAELVHDLRLTREQMMLEGRLPRPQLPRQGPRRVPLRTLVPLG